ncbi:hypothetical protein HQ544_00860 [Candidatus Falkowbacteria bacterium]|nr:hypothetical protein [Candidatus Falkowbacteria bacterium]
MSLKDKKITITKKMRPIRLAFLVDKEDKRTLHEVFRVNTCLWGGVYNPIIPFFKKIPQNWEGRHFRQPSAPSILKGYLNAFDPDYLVAKEKQKLQVSLFDKERLLSFGEVLNIKDDYHISFGVDITDLYGQLYDKDFKFERRHPIKVFCPKPSKEIALLSACCFGDFPSSKEMGYIKKNYSHCFNSQDLAIDQSNFLDCLLNEGSYPLRITRAELQASPRGWRADSSIFFIDATSWLDIVDYWNLRAVGRDVILLPKQYADSYIELVNKIIKRNFVPYRHNKDMMHHTNFICSRSSTMKEMQAFSKKLASPGKGAISLQHWYPRMWDEWAKDKDHVELCSIMAKEDSEEVLLDDNFLRFKDISPNFVDRYGGNGKPRWINILRFKDFYNRYDCPSVFPRNLKDAFRIFGAHSFDKAWISSEGINIPCKHYEGSHFFKIPTNFKVFEAWLKELGFEIELSGPGKILLKIIDSVGGIHGIWTFQKEEIIKLLNDMSHAAVESEVEGLGEGVSKSKVRGKTVPVKKWKDLLIKLDHNSPEIAERHFKNLLNFKILKGGIFLQCPECTQHTWYALDDLSDKVICERCLEKFDFPIVKPVSKSNWHLRTIGPFSVENYAQGGYCVALSLRFFGGHGLSNEMTWIPSFSIKSIVVKHDFQKLNLDTKGLWQNLIDKDYVNERGCVKPKFWVLKHFSDMNLEQAFVSKKEEIWKILSHGIEADFGIFLSQGRLDEIKPQIVIFGECKSFNEFTSKDVNRMRQIADNFPGAVIAFCTLRSILTDREKKIIAKLARRGRKHFKAEQWMNPVLILTGIELFNDFEPPYCWKGKGASHNAFADNWRVQDGIQELCNVTQQIYLGIESYWTWYSNKHRIRFGSS